MTSMVAVVPVRNGELCLGGDEAVAEAGGRAIVIGDGTDRAAASLDGVGTEVSTIEVGGFRPAMWATILSTLLAGENIVIVPNSPDGRDLAPRLAALLGRNFFSQAVRVTVTQARLLRHGSFEQVVTLDRPAVVTLQPGSRRVDRAVPPSQPAPISATVVPTSALALSEIGNGVASMPDLPLVKTTSTLAPSSELGKGADSAVDLPLIEVLQADPATIDLTEARRVVGAGAGLADAAAVSRLGDVGLRLGASLGATRVVTDAGWLGHDRQIGTTGVVINPDLYLAFGVSGASQHVMGLGDPSHIISVNTDASCPMMTMADLAIQADANETLRHLAVLLGEDE